MQGIQAHSLVIVSGKYPLLRRVAMMSISLERFDGSMRSTSSNESSGRMTGVGQLQPVTTCPCAPNFLEKNIGLTRLLQVGSCNNDTFICDVDSQIVININDSPMRT